MDGISPALVPETTIQFRMASAGFAGRLRQKPDERKGLNPNC